LHHEKEPELAKSYYESYINIDSKNPNAWTNLGLLYLKFNDFDNALKSQLKAVEFGNGYPNFHHNLAVVLYRKKCHQKAFEELAFVTETHPEFVYSQNLLMKIIRENNLITEEDMEKFILNENKYCKSLPEFLYIEKWEHYADNYNKLDILYKYTDPEIISLIEDSSSNEHLNFKKDLEEILIPSIERNISLVNEMKELNYIYNEKENKEAFDFINDLSLLAELNFKEIRVYENLLKMSEDDFYEKYDDELTEINNKADEIIKKWPDSFGD
jgi:hypothetical protein